MGNTACCEQAKEHPGPIQRLEDELVHKNPIPYHIEVASPTDQAHKHEELQEKPPAIVDQKQKELQDILQEEEAIQSPDFMVKEEPQHIQIPHLSANVSEVIENHHFFRDQLQNLAANRRKYHQDVYVGSLDESTDRPNGFGKMLKEDGSVYIGHFDHGKAQGAGVFIFPNGSYYKGDFKDNKAESQHGVFHSEAVKYTGGFKNNTFHGIGKEIGINYEFDGEYNKGTRVKGNFKWQALDGAYEYQGSFNSQNKFHATGVLREPNGVYEGQFVDGEKHGQGYFRSVSGYRYKGEYIHDARTGKGSIYDNNNELIYDGHVLNGLPHGKGKGIRNGKMVESTWDQGIQVDLIS